VKLSFCSLLFLEVLVLVAIGQQQEENGRKRVDITLNKTTEKPQNKNSFGSGAIGSRKFRRSGFFPGDGIKSTAANESVT